MNVWVVYFPCSGGGLVEPVIRFASNLDVLKTQEATLDSAESYMSSLFNVRGNISSRGTQREFPFYTFEDMVNNQDFEGTTKNTVYSINSITEDAKTDKIFDWVENVASIGDNIMYVGFDDPIFCIVAQQKNDPKVIRSMFMPDVRIKEWNENAETFADLERWQQREYLSMHLDFFFDLVPEQNKTAALKGWKTFVAEEFYTDTKGTMDEVCQWLNTTTKHDPFENLCTYWERNQVNIHQDYQSIIDAIHAIEIGDQEYKIQLRSTVYEAIIQRYLRVEKNISLKCFGLNTFPSTVKELQEYYE